MYAPFVANVKGLNMEIHRINSQGYLLDKYVAPPDAPYAAEYDRFVADRRGYNFMPLTYDIWVTWHVDYLKRKG